MGPGPAHCRGRFGFSGRTARGRVTRWVTIADTAVFYGGCRAGRRGLNPAGIVAALVVLVIVLTVLPYVALTPEPVLAAMNILPAYDWGATPAPSSIRCSMPFTWKVGTGTSS